MWSRAARWIGCCGLLAIGAASGCRPQLEPDEDAILYYFRNARVDGEVRRAWPEGQRYVDTVLAADAALWIEIAGQEESPEPEENADKEENADQGENAEQEENAEDDESADQDKIIGLEGFADRYSLWHRDDPRWRDADAVKERIDLLHSLLGGGDPYSLWNSDDPRWHDADAIRERIELLQKLLGEKRGRRMRLLDELTAAVDKVPTGFGGADATERCWQALSMEGMHRGLGVQEAIGALEDLGDAHRALLLAVEAVGDGFDPQGVGLAVADGERQIEIDSLYADLDARLQRRLDAFFDYAEAELLAAQVRSEERREREHLSARRAYLRKRLEAIPKALQIRAEKLAKEGDKNTTPAQKEFLIKQIDELDVARGTLKQRVEAILQRAKDATAATEAGA